MPPTNPPTPSFGRGYIPYFYSSGRYLIEHVPGSQAPVMYRLDSLSGYDFTSDLTGGRSVIPPRQTVEQVITRGYLAVPNADPSLAMITDTRHTSGMGLDDIIRQVRSRHELYQDNIYELEQGKCEAMNEVFRIEAEQGQPADSRQVYSMNKRIMDLYEQQRRERVTLWQDISRLRQTLPETAQQYLAAYRKTAILNDPTGDVP